MGIRVKNEKWQKRQVNLIHNVIYNLIFNSSRRASDDTVNYLSYWTDNGAFYYYHTEPNKTYSDTMLDIYADIRHGDTSAPFRSWNYDSWWYPKQS